MAMIFGLLGRSFGKLGAAGKGKLIPIVQTGDGTMNFSRLPANPAQSDALLVLFEDI